jgi:hypothetical protein
VGAVAALALVGAGCGGGADQPNAAPDGEVIEAYVRAMSDGDIDAAMALRCEDGRIAPGDREAFTGDLRRLIRDNGPLGVHTIEVTDERPDVAASLDGRNAVELTYHMTLDGHEEDRPLVAIVVDEDGERRICSVTTPELAEMQARLGEELADLGSASAGTLAASLPAPGPDDRLVRDGPMEPTTFTGALGAAVDGWSRAWQVDADSGVTVSALRFPSAQEAMDAARRWTARQDQAAVEVFAVPGVSGAEGVRILAYEWLWLQPPTVGPYVDEVSLVLGDTYVSVAVGGVATGSGHETATALAQDVARLAAG